MWTNANLTSTTTADHFDYHCYEMYTVCTSARTGHTAPRPRARRFVMNL